MGANKDRKFIEKTVRSIRTSSYKGTDKKKHKSLNKLSDLCRDYSSSSSIFQLLVEATREDSCDYKMVYRFLGICGKDMRRWVTPDGNTDTVGLFLEFECEVKDIMDKKGSLFLWDVVYGTNLVNKNILFGRISNVPLLLRYGLGLEFNESIQLRIEFTVLQQLAPFEQRSTISENMKQLPNRRRVMLVLLGMYSYFFKSKWNGGKVLRTIWRSIPDSILCRSEVTEVFACVTTDFKMLKEIMEVFEKFFCEDPFTELPQPRTLAHHSRCQIRHALNLCKALPAGVHQLAIPSKVQKYLLLES